MAKRGALVNSWIPSGPVRDAEACWSGGEKGWPTYREDRPGLRKVATNMVFKHQNGGITPAKTRE